MSKYTDTTVTVDVLYSDTQQRHEWRQRLGLELVYCGFCMIGEHYML